MTQARQQGSNYASPVLLKAGQRTHLAGTWDQDRLYLFVDGVLTASIPSTPGKYQVSPKFFVLGRYPEGRGGFVNGTIDEGRISHSARYTKNFIPAKQFEADADTWALYHFDEGSGDILHDASGNGHHGEIIEAEWVSAPSTHGDATSPSTASPVR